MPFISLDVEASGPLPGIHDLLSVGAELIIFDGIKYRPSGKTIYIELKPAHGGVVQEAMDVNRMDLEDLKRNGTPAPKAAQELADWVLSVSTPEDPAVFVGYVANFDWAYINDLFLRHDIVNPFGYRALDFRSLAMGVLPTPWQEIRHGRMAQELGVSMPPPDKAHNALVDATHQSELFCAILSRIGLRNALFHEIR